MARAGPRKVQAYSREFKLTAVRLSQQPGTEVQAVAAALDIHPFMLSNLIFHSDPGSEYSAAAFRDRLRALGMRQSSARRCPGRGEPADRVQVARPLRYGRPPGPAGPESRSASLPPPDAQRRTRGPWAARAIARLNLAAVCRGPDIQGR
jgi:hypothetical protein